MNTMFMRYGALRAPEEGGGGYGGGGGSAAGSAADGGEGGSAAVDGGAEGLPSGEEGSSSAAGGGGGEEGGSVAQQAALLAKEFDLSAPPQEGEEGKEPGDEGKEGEAEYALEFPEDFEAPDAFVSLATPVARQMGLDGKKAGAYAAGVVRAIQQAEQANFSKTAAELKEKWGRDYRANRAEAQKFYDWCREGGDFSDEDLRVFHSPKGVELLYKMSQRLGEKPAAQRPEAARQSEQEWAEAASSDPKHPDYNSLRDPYDPRFAKNRERYNRAKGYTM